MQQAVLITAYKNYMHLEEIIKFFDADFELYIHIDKKSHITKNELNKLNNYSNVKLISQKYKVNWGGFNHLKSILYLAEQALKNKQIFYFHLISGHDFPIKKIGHFKDYFEKNRENEFINYFEVPKPGWANNGGLDRIEYYNLYDVLDAKAPKQNGFIRRIISIQKRIKFKRPISSKMPKLYGGSTWWSLSRICLEYVIKYTKKNKFVMNRFKYSLCAEEFYFQTVIMNSPFANNVKNNSLRYIDWVARNGNNPAILDDADYEKIKLSDAFFARKFEFPLSIGVLNKIKTLVK
ncbi:MAG: beta-1,6-N-acetylglucosaminyltransferase [Lutibacter sp.]|nr:beta-1,6-N-acetylglucosaminyltransferase [Lutibacter sp.]